MAEDVSGHARLPDRPAANYELHYLASCPNLGDGRGVREIINEIKVQYKGPHTQGRVRL